ncbi:MAG: NAD(P)/FAD-dependent oxidoreductase, partial [Clostridia bacterium]|nr:NAD(P)/FAD-dependent oxidoreductase [Clostridia bacterium]
LLFEKNEKLGKKIYITGKGRCNFTNVVPQDEFLQNVVRGEKFLKGALYAFSSFDCVDFFENNGLFVTIERGNRAFPSSNHASDITKTLEKACREVGVSIFLNEKVEKINCATHNNSDMSNIITTPDIGIMPRVVSITTNKDVYTCDYVIIATGGISYPSTGSTGDGLEFARGVGHSVVDLKVALCGVNLKGEFFKQLQGLSLKNVKLTAKQGEKAVYEGFGEMLFTHFGISGPIVLSLSSYINRLNMPSVSLFLDLKPALDAQTLDKRLLRDFDKYKNKQIINALCELLPSKLIPIVLSFAKIDGKKSVNVLTKEERGRLVETLKALPMKPLSLRGFEEAIVTSGGVELKEINPKTMESKKVQGLKFCGEVLDVDALTGGFNLQIAFSTGYLAGNTIK